MHGMELSSGEWSGAEHCVVASEVGSASQSTKDPKSSTFSMESACEDVRM